MLERFDLEPRVAEADLGALALARRQRHHLVGGKRPLGENPEHFAAHVARGTDYRDLVTHRSALQSNFPAGPAPAASALLGENGGRDNAPIARAAPRPAAAFCAFRRGERSSI